MLLSLNPQQINFKEQANYFWAFRIFFDAFSKGFALNGKVFMGNGIAN